GGKSCVASQVNPWVAVRCHRLRDHDSDIEAGAEGSITEKRDFGLRKIQRSDVGASGTASYRSASRVIRILIHQNSIILRGAGRAICRARCRQGNVVIARAVPRGSVREIEHHAGPRDGRSPGPLAREIASAQNVYPGGKVASVVPRDRNAAIGSRKCISAIAVESGRRPHPGRRQVRQRVPGGRRAQRRTGGGRQSTCRAARATASRYSKGFSGDASTTRG